MLMLFDLALIILYPSLYEMEKITRYPHTDFSYYNLDHLSTNMEKPCQKIIETVLVKTVCKPGSSNVPNLPS